MNSSGLQRARKSAGTISQGAEHDVQKERLYAVRAAFAEEYLLGMFSEGAGRSAEQEEERR
jgi:hypothetical protein